MKVKVYENGTEKDIGIYDEHRLTALCDTLNAFCNQTKEAGYWFEAEAFLVGSCFQKRKTVLEVRCYQENRINPLAKRKIEIPHRYRKKFFDKRHTIDPRPYGSMVWPAHMEVRFVLPKN